MTHTKKTVSEAMLRYQVKKQARKHWVGSETLDLSGETIGVACAITKICNPIAALDELVQDALHRWARLQVVEYAIEARKDEEEELPTSAQEDPASKQYQKLCAERDEALCERDLLRTQVGALQDESTSLRDKVYIQGSEIRRLSKRLEIVQERHDSDLTALARSNREEVDRLRTQLDTAERLASDLQRERTERMELITDLAEQLRHCRSVSAGLSCKMVFAEREEKRLKQGEGERAEVAKEQTSEEKVKRSESLSPADQEFARMADEVREADALWCEKQRASGREVVYRKPPRIDK